ncbi:MAG: hypothetical protein ACREXW_04895 [Gammaproteobacteria bacterium]
MSTAGNIVEPRLSSADDEIIARLVDARRAVGMVMAFDGGYSGAATEV